MTATVTPPHILDKFDDLAPMSGDRLARFTYGLLDIRKPAGQLWERVAETRSNAPAPLTARQDEGIVRAYAGIGHDRGNLICDPSWRLDRHTHPSAHGIIRAGQRTK